MKMYTEIKKNFHWFSLIELLVSISILATISIVGYVSYSGHMKIVNNTTRIQTIDSLYLSLSDYHQMKKTLPEPNSNYISYDERGTYMHSLSGSYGVSGYVSNNFLPAGYLNFYAIDPESKQFYGYGKLTDNTAFDVAAALYDDTTGGYKTYLRGTYQRSRLSSLIRSYSSSNFVSQDSTENLPYNPYERKITAYISSYSGTVTLSGTTTTPLSLTGELNSGDTLIVGTGGSALLHISDGSELSLGSAQSQTELSLDSLRYDDNNNLSSKVALILKSWEIWAEAPHYRTEMDSESDLSIQTDTAVAAVRGTVFGVSRSSLWVTAFSLASGKLEVAKLSATGSQIPFAQNFSTTATGGFIIDNAKSYMVVPDGGQPIKLDNITNDTTTRESTSVSSESDEKIHHPKFSLGYRPKADKISFQKISGTNTGVLSVTFQNYGADSYYISFGTKEIDNDKKFPIIDPNPSHTGTLTSTGTLTITGSFAYLSWERVKRTYVLRVCSHGYCSAPDIKVLGGSEFAFDNFKVWGEKKKTESRTAVRDWTTIDKNCSKSDIVIGSQTWAGCNSTIGSTAITYPNSNLQATDSFGNPFGAYYRWDILNTNNCLETGISENNTICPCKDGYHIPTQSQWQTAYDNQRSNLPVILKLSRAGYQNTSGVLIDAGVNGMYWSSSRYSTSNVYNLGLFTNTTIFPDYNGQTNGFSVRCIKN